MRQGATGTKRSPKITVTVVVWLRLPEVPVIVTVAVPTDTGLLAVKVKVVFEVPLVGLKLAVNPDGRPDAKKLTVPLNPFNGFTVMVLVTMLPCVSVTLAGDAESEKSGVAGLTQLGNLKLEIRVFQLKIPVFLMYSVVNQKVQSSTGSTCMVL